jgi:hypothetical protein
MMASTSGSCDGSGGRGLIKGYTDDVGRTGSQPTPCTQLTAWGRHQWHMISNYQIGGEQGRHFQIRPRRPVDGGDLCRVHMVHAYGSVGAPISNSVGNGGIISKSGNEGGAALRRGEQRRDISPLMVLVVGGGSSADGERCRGGGATCRGSGVEAGARVRTHARELGWGYELEAERPVRGGGPRRQRGDACGERRCGGCEQNRAPWSMLGFI